MQPSMRAAASRNRRQSLHRLLSSVRLGEVLVLQGSPLLGALFAMRHPTASSAGSIALLGAGSTLLVAHVFVLNDWSGFAGDLRDPNRTGDTSPYRGIGGAGLGYLSITLLGMALLLLGFFGYWTLTIALAIACLSALYSFPGIHMKGAPLLNSGLHFAGGLLHFLLGYSVFTAPDWRGVAIGSFFALIFVAGHLTHETRDCDSDRANGIMTNAAKFGKRRTFLWGLALFTAADLLLTVLALRGTAPHLLAVIPVIVPLHVYWSASAIRSGLTFETVRRVQTGYRYLYAAVGLLMVAGLLARLKV